MKVEVRINPNAEEKIIIEVKKVDDEIQSIIQNIQNMTKQNKIIGQKDEKIYIFDIEEIETFFSNNGKVYLKKDNKDYIIKNKLYEIEQRLSNNFIRISNSEIINFKKVESLDLHFIGTVEFKFKSGYVTYASRRNIKKIKEYLKL